MDSVDGHVFLCELSGSVVLVTPRAACHHVAEVCFIAVCIDLRHAAAPQSLRASFWEVRYRHCYKSFIKLDMEENQSANKRFTWEMLVKHAPVEPLSKA